MTWIPAYGIAKAKARLNAQGAQAGPATALTHLALQFWAPTLDGGIAQVTKYGAMSDGVIGEWRDWAHARGIRAVLCVYNGGDKWDWGLARKGFQEHPQQFCDGLASEAQRLDLDAVDIDLEGDGPFEADKPAFLAFMQSLSEKLHAQGKQLFVDSFSYVWNAPNQHWWHDLFPLVDGLTTMGYEETGATASGWRAYSAQVTAAWGSVEKLLIGMPSHIDRWAELGAIDQVAWIAKDGGPGLAIWDAQLQSETWRTPEIWRQIALISHKDAK
jgi:hypothetical protein